jgi:phosphoserine phosphatase RsbX
MNMQPAISQSLVAWGVARRAAPGETLCGDWSLVKPVPEGVLLAAVDGLGHGKEAAAVAHTAIATLERHASQPLSSLVQRCHEALVRTRGVVMTLAFVHATENRLTWLGVGNVEAVLVRAGTVMDVSVRRVMLRGGLVGYQLPALYSSDVAVAPGDLIIFATDGIWAGFTRDLAPGRGPQQLADDILGRHFKGTDDALVLAVRYLGGGNE